MTQDENEAKEIDETNGESGDTEAEVGEEEAEEKEAA